MKLAALLSGVSASYDFIKVDGIIYQIHKKNGKLTNFWDNKEYCDGLGADWKMPTPTNAAENNVVQKMLEKNNGGTFIGFAQASDHPSIQN